MQDEPYLGDAPLYPKQLSILGSTSGSLWKQQLGITKGFHHGASRTQAAERLKQSANTLLYLLVGIENPLARNVVEEAHGKWQLQFPSLRFVEQAAAHASLHHVQFGFAHRTFQPEQKPIIKMGGIVEAILI